jgi:hypothetical protein
MAAKKKSKKKHSAKKPRAKKVQSKKVGTKKARTAKVSSKKSKGSAKKKPAKKKSAPRKIAVKRSGTRGATGARRQTPDSSFPELQKTQLRRGSREVPALSGDADSQGLSETERADSESVSELLEEGNAFEAGVVRGVERAEDDDERGVREVRTHEFPEDDVPEEYLDQD